MTPAPVHFRAELHRLMGEINAGNVGPAVVELRQLVSSWPNLGDGHFVLGLGLSMAQDNVAALESFQQALHIDRRNPVYQFQCGMSLQHLGRADDAAGRYREAIRLNPKFHEAHYNLGLLLQNQGSLDGAIRCYRCAIMHKPDMVEALNNLGSLLTARGQPAEALQVLHRALSLRPDFHVPYNNVGTAMIKLGRSSEAIAAFRRALNLAPDFVEAMVNLAEQHQLSGNNGEALALYARAAALDPGNELIRFSRDSLAHNNPPRPPDEYVRRVFREMAHTFDQHLVEDLDYRIPQILKSELATWIAQRAPVAVLDLGCGTGLFGAEIKAHANRLVGIDLSPEMLAMARSRRQYDELHEAELVAYLRDAAADSFDLAVAADVFIYVGDVTETFELVRRILKTGGRFAFSVEKIENAVENAENALESYRLGESGRYSHARSHIEMLAKRCGFAIAIDLDRTIRKERNKPVQGSIFVLEKTGNTKVAS